MIRKDTHGCDDKETDMDLGWTAASLGASAAASFVGGKAADKAWHALTGKESPTKLENEEEGSAPLLQVVVFAALSAAIVALVQHFAVRETKKWYGPRIPKDQIESGS